MPPLVLYRKGSSSGKLFLNQSVSRMKTISIKKQRETVMCNTLSPLHANSIMNKFQQEIKKGRNIFPGYDKLTLVTFLL